MRTKNQVNEIGLFDFARKIWEKKLLIIFVALLFALAAFLYSSFLAVPKYYSTTSVYVVNKTDSDYKTITAQDLQVGSFLVNDYKEIIKSADVLNKVIEIKGLKISAEKLNDKVTVESPFNTRVLSITVWETSPKAAVELADSIREVAAEKIKDITKVEDVTTLQSAKLMESATSPNIKLNVIIGFGLGLVLASILIILLELLDDRIKHVEDIEDTLGLPILGVVPKFEKIRVGGK